MNPTPKDFFVGLIDFFSILLPGVLLTYFLRDGVADLVLPVKVVDMSPAEKWMVVAVSSYLLGHFVFLLASWLDELYDMIRRLTLNQRIRRLARTGELMSKPLRALLWLVFKREQDLAVDLAGRIKEHYLRPFKKTVNTFQWAKARLTLEKPEALAVVQRFEADSKFFRSLVVVLPILFILRGWHGRLFLTAELILLLLVLWRFMEQRYKATNQAYWFILALEAKEARDTRFALPSPKPGDLTHAGGVVYCGEAPDIKYLLVEAKNDHIPWVLPKGHIELGELNRETAVREVYEETGVWATIVCDLAEVEYEVNGSTVRAKFYLMRKLEERSPREFLRKKCWLPYEEAKQKATHPESKGLLDKAEEILVREATRK